MLESERHAMINPIYVDLHVHTHFSPCGRPAATAEALIRRAQDKGIVALGFADHITPYPVPGCTFYTGQRSHLIADLRDEIAQVTHTADIKLLVGIEAKFPVSGVSNATWRFHPKITLALQRKIERIRRMPGVAL